jgi:hypothetical protein
MGYMKKMWLEMLLEPSSPYEPTTRYSILEKAVDSAILDLEKANGKGIFAEHRKVLTWTALRTLKQARENLHEEN